MGSTTVHAAAAVTVGLLVAACSPSPDPARVGVAADVTSQGIVCQAGWGCVRQAALIVGAPLFAPASGWPVMPATVDQQAATGSARVVYTYRPDGAPTADPRGLVFVIGVCGPKWTLPSTVASHRHASVTAAHVHGDQAVLVSYRDNDQLIWRSGDWTWRMSTSAGQQVLHHEAHGLRVVGPESGLPAPAHAPGPR